jgi:16S rRNA (guanine966-N2)-methyltransferase
MPIRSPRSRAPGRRNAVRIIGGAWRRSVVHFPDMPELRPTPDRVRETLFNWLGQDLTGLTCLDLFAGSGALGLEAASRGASAVTLVEHHAPAYAALLENVRRLGASTVRVEKLDALEFLSRGDVRFDVVFLDPPFRRGVDPDFLERLDERLADDGRVYLESDAPFTGAPAWSVTREGRAGKVHYQLLRRSRELR